MNRKIKIKIKSILSDSNFKKKLNLLENVSNKKLVNALLSLLYSHKPLIKWRSVSTIAYLVSFMENKDIESARIVMRQLMWNLNHESGGIGWGSVEAMGEITATNKKMSDEFSNIIVSYINPKGNFLEYYMLQRGTVWAFGRLAHSRPEKVKKEVNLIDPFLISTDPQIRGTAAWAVGPIKNRLISKKLELLINDQTCIEIYIDTKLQSISIGTLAEKALAM